MLSAASWSVEEKSEEWLMWHEEINADICGICTFIYVLYYVWMSVNDIH